MRKLAFEIVGVSSLVGRKITIGEWARQFKVPDRKQPGAFLSGKRIQEITGVENKSWDPELFRDFDAIVAVAKDAIASAQLSPRQIDAVMVITLTPYQLHFDQDSLDLLRELRIPDSVVPIQINSACAGMARAMTIASQLKAKHILMVTYHLMSLYSMDGTGGLIPHYVSNAIHPHGKFLWMTPAIFGDAAAAMVLRGTAKARGLTFYTRDALSFGDQPGLTDPMMYLPGGGASHPPGSPNSQELSCFAMTGDGTSKYYYKGMRLNHEYLASHRPSYLHEISRMYIHQGSPKLIKQFLDEFVETTGIDRELVKTNVSTVKDYGNFVSASTIKPLHDDIVSGVVKTNDEICISAVGAGPERGASILPIG
jgi:3-oxoacyl-[acyl-carrier-protein] synthase-3